MTPVPLHELGFVLIAALVTGLIAWRTWRRGQIRLSERLSTIEDALFKRTPEGWTFDSPYPRTFGRQRWTYLLTDAQKERLAERLRRRIRRMRLVMVGSSVLLAIPLAYWLPRLPDVLRWLLVGSLRPWLLLCLLFVLVLAMLATAVFIAQKRVIHPVLRDARRIRPARPVSSIKLMAESTAVGELRSRIIWITVLLLACALVASVMAYLMPSSSDAELLLVIGVLLGLLDAWYVMLLVAKLRAARSPPDAP